MNYLIIITQADVFVLRRYIVLHILLPINNPGKNTQHKSITQN